MPVYEELQDFFFTTPDGIKQITLSFDQIMIILHEDLPEEAYKESEFWNNNPINADGPSRTWLKAGWEVTKMNLLERRIEFSRSGEKFNLPPKSIKERVGTYIEQYLIKWLNRYPDDPEHYVSIQTNSYKTYWMIIDERYPNEIFIDRFGNPCGYIKFTCDEKSIEIHDIFIFKGHRGDGLGTHAMKFFLSTASYNGFEQVEARVQPEDDFPLDKLMSWYEKFGFKTSPPGSKRMIRMFTKQSLQTKNLVSVSKEEIKTILHECIDVLKKNDWKLLVNDVSERSITHKLAEYFQIKFPNLNVDCEYNRNSEKGLGEPKSIYVLKCDFKDNTISIKDDEYGDISVYPDIIIHRRMSNKKNLLVIEVKKDNSKISCDYDHRKLEAFTENSEANSYHFQYGVFIKIKTGEEWKTKPSLMWFVDGHEIPDF